MYPYAGVAARGADVADYASWGSESAWVDEYEVYAVEVV